MFETPNNWSFSKLVARHVREGTVRVLPSCRARNELCVFIKYLPLICCRCHAVDAVPFDRFREHQEIAFVGSQPDASQTDWWRQIRGCQVSPGWQVKASESRESYLSLQRRLILYTKKFWMNSPVNQRWKKETKEKDDVYRLEVNIFHAKHFVIWHSCSCFDTVGVEIV